MSTQPELSEFNALVSLLDEPDEHIYENIERQLIEWGEFYIPNLNDILHNTFNKKVYARLQHIIQQANYNHIAAQIKNWIASENTNLIDAFIEISKIEDVDIDNQVIFNKIDVIKNDIWIELNENLTALEQVKVFNNIFYSKYGFKGIGDKPLIPEHYSIHALLENKTAGPLAIGILYLHIAQQTKIPVFGVNFMHNFILGYTLEQTIKQKAVPLGKVLFYINPSKVGIIFSENELELFIKENKLPHRPANFLPISNYMVIFVLLSEMKLMYQFHKQKVKQEQINRILELFGE
jgi:regulator of sirC expression with transglutaminase-like and TPR domain